MKKEISLALTMLLFTATPVFAHFDTKLTPSIRDQQKHFSDLKPKNNDNDNDQDDNTILTPNPTIIISGIPCDRFSHLKNQGTFVSCAAHVYSKIKKHDSDSKADEAEEKYTGKYPIVTPTSTISETPTPTATVMPTETAGTTEEPTPSDSITPSSDTPTPDFSNQDTYNPPTPKINFGINFGKIFTFLIHLL